jgi:predicted TIM-barrel fold metal-dependent hydrolase
LLKSSRREFALAHAEEVVVIEHSDGATTPLIDASVHIFCESNADLRQGFMREPFRSRGFPDYEMDWYGAPGGEYAAGTTGPAESTYPGSSPDLVAAELFERRGVDVAVLHPMTRGIMPDRHLGTAIACAHNDMMITRWLDHREYGDRFRGTARINPDDVSGALREIARLRDHPRVVQLGVPMQSRELYGKPQFWPLWEAAADAGLPIAVHIETGSGIGFSPTPSGGTRTFEQYLGFMSLNYVYHLMNMIAEGVFARFPELKFIWADGAADMLTPFMWRMDCFGRPHLEQTPWAPNMPSDYLPGHVYFVQGSLDGPVDADFAGDWFDFTGKSDMTMYGSSYPHWHNYGPTAPASFTAEQRDKLFWRNAAELYDVSTPAIESAMQHKEAR